MKRNLVIYNFILTVLTVLFIGAGVVYAFFYDTVLQPMPKFSVSGEGFIDIDNEFDLKLLAKAGYYNDSNYITKIEQRQTGLEGGISTIKERKSIRLTKNIKLTQDLLISADVNIDLGGETCGIDLNGHNITIKHYYFGCFLITNGSFKNLDLSNPSLLFIDTPNAVIIGDYIIDRFLDSINDNNIVSFSKAALVNEIFNFTDTLFTGFYKETIQGTSDLQYYIYKDLQLIKSFYNLDIDLQWQSNDLDVISSNGIISSALAVDSDAELTLTLSGGELDSLEGGALPDILFKTYIIKVLSGDRKDIGVNEIESYLSYYKFVNNNYYINKDVELPAGNKYYGITYSYETIDPTDLAGNTLKLGETQRHFSLTAVITDSQQNEISNDYEIYTVLKNNYEIVNDLTNGFSPLKITDIYTVLPLTTPSELLSLGVLVEYFIIDIDDVEVYYYSVVTDEANSILKVEILPQFTDIIYLNAVYTFVSGPPIERKTRINFRDSEIGGETGDDKYIKHYEQINNLLIGQIKTDNRTHTTFSLPNNYGDDFDDIPYYDIFYFINCDKLSSINDSGYTYLYYPEFYSTYLQDYVIKLNPFYNGNTETEFIINKDRLKTEEIDITLSYKFDIEPDLYKSKNIVTLHGIIHNYDMPDPTLYAHVLNYYDVENDATGESTADGILTLYEARMYKEDGFSIVDSLIPIDNFKGINFLLGTYSFIFNNTTIGDGAENEATKYLSMLPNVTSLTLIYNEINNEQLSRFKNIKSLVNLDLSNNQIESLESITTIFTSVSSLNLSDNLLTNLKGLEKFINVTNLDVNSNEIVDFRNLLNIKSFNKDSNVYIYDNNDALFGSQGVYSLTTLVLLWNKDIKIYNIDDNDYFNPEDELELLAGTQILESIFLVNHTKTMIILPSKIYYTSNDFYPITWYYTALTSPSISSNTPRVGEDTITHATPEGKYVIFASVDINGTIVYRPFYIEVLLT